MDKKSIVAISLVMLSLIALNANMIAHANSDPVASFTYSPSEPHRGETVTFDASESYDPDGGTIVSYEWHFGDGGTGSGKTVTHAYSSPGHYIPFVVVTDNYGLWRWSDGTTLIDVMDPSPGGAIPSDCRFHLFA